MQPPIPQPRLNAGPAPVPLRGPRETPPEEESFLTKAPLTSILIALNVAIFALQVWHAAHHPDPDRPGSLASLGGMPEGTLLAFGANDSTRTVGDGRLETLVSSMFLHGDILHLVFNMVALRQVGVFLERAVTPTRMMPLYVLSGVVASLSSALVGWFMNAERLSVGASGAICGLVGAALVTGYRIEGPSSPVMRIMARWLLSIVIFGLVVRAVKGLSGSGGGVDNAAHLGGAISGAVVAMLWKRGRSPAAWVRTASTVGFVALLAATATAVVVRENVSDSPPNRGGR